jgi:hypothetical protein
MFGLNLADQGLTVPANGQMTRFERNEERIPGCLSPGRFGAGGAGVRRVLSSGANVSSAVPDPLVQTSQISTAWASDVRGSRVGTNSWAT